MGNKRPLNVGLIGGSKGFITNAHQRAIFMDGTRRVTAAALSSNPENALRSAEEWPYPITGYESYDAMLEQELGKPQGERIDYVLIQTPNHAHFDPAKKFIEAGIPVFCEKPLTLNLEESQTLCRLVNEKIIPFCVAHTYLGHWTTRLARHIVQSGLLGDIRWVDSSYHQSWMAMRASDPDIKKTTWRLNKNISGISNCGGDIGTHALMQLRYITGLEVKELSAHLESFFKWNENPDDNLDDHFTAYCRLSNGGKGLVRATQIAIGHKNDLRIEVNGEKGSLRWAQEESEKLQVYPLGKPDRVYYRDPNLKPDDFLEKLPQELLDENTIPWGHSEGFHDAFARLHRCFENDVRAYQTNAYTATDGSKYATVEDGLAGIQFIEKAVESSRNNGCWLSL
ncbi:MAG: Gfo/Idh/MocA family oxidoreductase [Verrucomicrobia bacterium]|nr:Gfo/Idh/MocA family oxidoreductase [Verrucomicrobiota bacterium]MDA1066389.1 Gfo/Idh/MocA family oxidoreductase [Verrucomicrobiota bacterium]